MGDPSVVCQSLGGTSGAKDSCVLSPPAENADLKDWDYLLNFRPLAVKDRLTSRFPSGDNPVGYQPIESGYGPVNLDFYPIQITKLPVVGGTEIQPEALVKYMRQYIQSFAIVKFKAYGEEYPDSPGASADKPLWMSDNPVGAVLDINFTPTVYEGSVVAAESTPAYWIFSTVWATDTHFHPVSGNRQFGYAVLKAGTSLGPVYQKAGISIDNANQDAVYIFTRGADRCSGLKYWAQTDTTFGKGHACWLAFQQMVLKYLVENGGGGYVPGCVSERWDWDGVLKSGYLWHNPSQ